MLGSCRLRVASCIERWPRAVEHNARVLSPRPAWSARQLGAAGDAGGKSVALLASLLFARSGRRSVVRRFGSAVGGTAPAHGRSALRVCASSGAVPWQNLERIYCVNLDRRPERWEYMQRQFAKLRMPIVRWSAVDGKTLDVFHLVEIGLIAREALPRYLLPEEQKLFGTDLTDGGIGCALSHMQIWRDIVLQHAEGTATADSVFLVLEDDCLFLDGFSEASLFERLSHVPSDWELVYLGGQDLMRKQHLYEVGPGVRRLYKGFRETTAYLMNPAGARSCLEVCVPMYWQVDTHLNDMSTRQGLRRPRPDETEYTMKPRGYCLFPPIVAQDRRYPTDVQKMEHD